MNLKKTKADALDSLNDDDLFLVLKANTSKLYKMLIVHGLVFDGDLPEVISAKRVQYDLIEYIAKKDKNILVNGVIAGLCDSAEHPDAINYVWNTSIDFNAHMDLSDLFDDDIVKAIISDEIKDRILLLKEDLSDAKQFADLNADQLQVTNNLIDALNVYKRVYYGDTDADN